MTNLGFSVVLRGNQGNGSNLRKLYWDYTSIYYTQKLHEVNQPDLNT